jgi:hypothetical protein
MKELLEKGGIIRLLDTAGKGFNTAYKINPQDNHHVNDVTLIEFHGDTCKHYLGFIHKANNRGITIHSYVIGSGRTVIFLSNSEIEITLNK